MQVQHFMYFTRLCTLLTFWVYTPLLYQNLTFCTELHHSKGGRHKFSCRKQILVTLCFLFFFYIVFVHYLWNIDLNLANKRQRKVLIWRVVITFNSRFIDKPSLRHDVNRTLRRPVISCIYLWHCLRVTSRERVSFMGVWTSSVLNRFI